MIGIGRNTAQHGANDKEAGRNFGFHGLSFLTVVESTYHPLASEEYRCADAHRVSFPQIATEYPYSYI
jgi:hypothetical protein